MRKVVINRCYGGFELSPIATLEYHKRKNPGKQISLRSVPSGSMCFIDEKCIDQSDFDREDPLLIEIVEAMGDTANGKFSDLKVVEIPEDVDYVITDYDGMEQIEEKHRIWC